MMVLASNSPRRKQLLSLGGWKFLVMPAQIDEQPLPGEYPRQYVLRLASGKAQAVLPHAPPSSIVVAADTTVADGDAILGKPQSAAEAEAMLQRLRGRVHQVYTGLAVVSADQGEALGDVCVTSVRMRNYSDEEIKAYIATGDPLDKAGAYAIQHAGFKPVESFDSCYANVMGLPLCYLTRMLGIFGVYPEQDLWQACQEALDYQCPVLPDVLAEVSRGDNGWES